MAFEPTSSARRRSAGEAACEITWGEVFAVLPFGNRTVIETFTGAQLTAGVPERLLRPCCDLGGRDRSVPADLRPEGRLPLQRHRARRSTGSGRRRTGPAGTLTPIGPTDTVRIVTNDFMFTGGDGYTALTGGTNVPQPGDDLLQVAIDYITANSPVGPVVEGRFVKN